MTTYQMGLTRDEKLRAMRMLLKERGITVRVDISKRLNIEGMMDLIAVTNRCLRKDT